jgi:WD40 repeat protein/nucleoside phosphorylase
MPINFTEKSLQDIQPHIKKGLILLVTATETETNALHEKLSPLPNENNIIEVTIENSTYYIGTFGLYAIAHVECLDMGSSGSGGSSITVSNAIPILDPKFVLMIGIAFGVDEEKQNIGDVLVSNTIVPYETQRVSNDGIIHRGPRPPATKKLRNHFKSIRNWNFKLENGKKANLVPCEILSGLKLVDNIDYRNDLKIKFPDAKGGEMEGSGLFDACEDKNKDWILVKAICDFADGNKKEGKAEKQALAMQSVLSACLFLFNKKLVFNEYKIKPIISQSEDKPPDKNFKKYFGLGLIGLIAICLPFFNKKGEQSNEDLSNSILAKDLSAINETDNTLALRLAQKAYELNPSEKATEVFHGILSDTNSYFYQRIYEEHDSAVQSVVVSADGKKILSAAEYGVAILRNFDGSDRVDIPNKDYINNKHKGRLLCTAISPDGQHIVTGGEDKMVKLWNNKGDFINNLYDEHNNQNGHSGYVRSVAFSHHGKYIVTASYDSTAKIWDAETYKCLKILPAFDKTKYPKGHKGIVISASFSPDDKFIITGCGNNDSVIRIWEWKTERVEEEIITPNGKGSNSVAFSPNGNIVAIGAHEIVYTYNRKEKKGKSLGKHKDYITSVVFSCTGDSLLTGSSDKTCILWNLKGNKLKTLRGHDDTITSVCFTSSCNQILTGSLDCTIKLWNIYEENIKTLYNHKGSIKSIVFLNDSILLTGSDDKTAILWLFKRNKYGVKVDSLFTFKGHSDFINSVVFINDVTILTASQDSTILKWDKLGKEYKSSIFHREKFPIYSMSYSAIKEYIVVGNGNEVIILNKKGDILRSYSAGSVVYSVTFTSDGERILFGCNDNTVKRWDLNNHKDSIKILKMDSQVYTLCTKKDEFIVGTLKKNGMNSTTEKIKICSIDKMANIKTIEFDKNHYGDVYTAAYSNDVKYFISGHQNIVAVNECYYLKYGHQNAFLWNKEGKCLKTFSTMDNTSIFTSTFSPDDKTVVMGNADNRIQFWRSLTDILDTSTTAALSEGQKKRYK